jgi:hypothetical protein
MTERNYLAAILQAVLIIGERTTGSPIKPVVALGDPGVLHEISLQPLGLAVERVGSRRIHPELFQPAGRVDEAAG